MYVYHMLIGHYHMLIPFCEMSAQVSGPFFIALVCHQRKCSSSCEEGARTE